MKNNIAIIVSENDLAGLNIKERLISEFNFSKTGDSFDGRDIFSFENARLYTLKTDTVFAEGLDERIEADLFIFATRHQASSEMSTLSVHTPGNFGTADFGGSDGKLCVSLPFLMKKAMMKLNDHNSISYNVTMEATHHGPYLEKPAMFIEIGSTEKEWRNIDAGRIIAQTISELVIEGIATSASSAVGIGGSHYCSGFNKFCFEGGFAVGHVCPKYHADKIDKAMLLRMAEKTSPRAEIFLIDWKGLNSLQRSSIISMIEELGLKYLRA